MEASKREPMLSVEEIMRKRPFYAAFDTQGNKVDEVLMPMSEFDVQQYYENLITSGELIIRSPVTVRTGGQESAKGRWYTKNISPIEGQSHWVTISADEFVALVEAGAKIIK